MCAMDSGQKTDWLDHMATAGIVVVCAGIGYYAYTSWAGPKEQAAVRQLKASRKPVYFASPALHHQEEQLVFQPLSDEEVNPLFRAPEVQRFQKLSLKEQRRIIAQQIIAYGARPIIPALKREDEDNPAFDAQQEAQDIIYQYVQHYCLCTKTHELECAINKLFAAKERAEKEQIVLAIQRILG